MTAGWCWSMEPADSRGGRGTFLPVPDVDVGQVTRRESEDFRRFARDIPQWGPRIRSWPPCTAKRWATRIWNG